MLWICNGFNAKSGSSILDQSVSGYRDLITKNCKICSIFLKSKIAIYLSLALHEDIKATREASTPQKRTSTFKTINFFTFSLFGSFLSTWTRIKPVKINAEPIHAHPDPQQWFMRKGIFTILPIHFRIPYVFIKNIKICDAVQTQCCGSGMFTPDPDFYPGSRIQKQQQKRRAKIFFRHVPQITQN
jgi:hypothetical protein